MALLYTASLETASAEFQEKMQRCSEVRDRSQRAAPAAEEKSEMLVMLTRFNDVTVSALVALVAALLLMKVLSTMKEKLE